MYNSPPTPTTEIACSNSLKFSEFLPIDPTPDHFIQRLPLTLAKENEKEKDCDELCKIITEFAKPITSPTLLYDLISHSTGVHDYDN